MPVPKPPQPDVNTTNAIAAYQQTIDDFVAANQAVYDQQASLQQQSVDIAQQLSAINAQIVQMEAGDVATARQAIAALNAIATGRPQVNRRF